jgi:transcriptional regulator with XRE-family HTH domain
MMAPMTPLAEKDLPSDQSRAIARAAREELARRRISRQFLADEARISISTLEKALSGRRPFTLATTIRLEEALGMRLRGSESIAEGQPHAGALAPDSLGSYSHPAVAWIEGSYLTLRPSFGDPRALYAYRTEISWDERSSSLAFREAERLDTAFTQYGSVSVPNQSGHIYLVTNRHGQYRIAVLGRPTIGGVMCGILTTLQAGRGTQLTPVSAPIALVPIRPEEKGELQFGRITPGQGCYLSYRRYLAHVTEDQFAVFLGAPPEQD